VKYVPYPYQVYAEQFILEHPAAGLLLDMGMGKSVITLSALCKLLYDYFTTNRVLVIAPLQPATETWPAELEKWDHLRCLTYAVAVGDVKERIAALQQGADITIVNVDVIPWLVAHYKRRWPFDCVVIDELSKFKSMGARWKSVRRVRKYIKRIVALTGTPAPDGLIGLWPQMYLLDGGAALGPTLTSYREQYFRADKYINGHPVRWTPKPGAEPKIYSRLEGLCVSMMSEDYIQLPERLDVRHNVTLPPDALAKYRQMERDMLLPYTIAKRDANMPDPPHMINGAAYDSRDGYINAGSAGILANKLLQMAGGAAYDSEGRSVLLNNAKLEALQQLIDEANGQPVLVFYGFKHELARLQARFPAVDVREPGAVERWNRGEIPVMLAHPASAGHGLNLQDGGHIAVWYSLPWSLELYQQANKRLHRMGQKHPVLIHHLVAAGTIDEHVLDVLSGKAKTQDGLLQALKARMEEIADA